MSDVYEEAFHHFIWATKRREAMILPGMESLLYTHIRQKCWEMKTFVHAVHGMPDHVHLVCSLSPIVSVSDFIKGVKGSSSHYVNHHEQGSPLRWQVGYAHLTLAKHDLPSVVAYMQNQKTRHAEGRLWPALERLPDD